MIDSDPDGPFRYPVSDVRDQDEAEPGITPSQTVGPYVHIGLTWDGAEDMVPAGTPDSDVLEAPFTVTDGAGHRVLGWTDQNGSGHTRVRGGQAADRDHAVPVRRSRPLTSPAEEQVQSAEGVGDHHHDQPELSGQLMSLGKNAQ